jgi:hypothetical protein
VRDITRDEDFMENLGLRETFSKLNLSEVEPKVRYI